MEVASEVSISASLRVVRRWRIALGMLLRRVYVESAVGITTRIDGRRRVFEHAFMRCEVIVRFFVHQIGPVDDRGRDTEVPKGNG